MEEWKMRITKYADRLIDDLDALPWPEHIKEAQRRWIGRSEGAKLYFELSFKKDPTHNERRDPDGNPTRIEVFTTRPDTLFGATYLVLAPEHPWVRAIWDTPHDNAANNKDEIAAYVTAATKKTEIERQENKAKTGVRIDGVTAINPATGEEIPIYVADYVLAGYGTGAIMAVPAHDERDFAFAEKFKIPSRQVLEGEGELPFAESSALINSDEFNEMNPEEAKGSITVKVGGEITNTYRLRDWSIGRQRYWGVPIPIVYDPEGKPHAIPAEHLPWHLPTDVDFTPTGEPPLAKSKELKERAENIFGKGWTPEVETMDTFVDSSWYFLRYLDNNNNEELASLDVQRDWMPVDLYFGGAEHTTMHLLYSRFWQKALLDLGLASESEPYKMRINRGLVLGPDGNKMSKSKGNVIDPDKEVVRLGADTVKMYLAFMGPYGEAANYPWDLGGIAGIRRFLERVYGLRDHVAGSESEEMTKLLHKTIKKVSEDIEAFKFNTAISTMMVYVNTAERDGLSDVSYDILLRLLAPFAPHLTEELWHDADHVTSIHEEKYPTFDPELVVEKEVTIGVQINGKMRGNVTVATEASEEVVLSAIQTQPKLQERLVGEMRKVIYVPGRIINIIIDNG
jgi:leucyl-tRNA synthetase